MPPNATVINGTPVNGSMQNTTPQPSWWQKLLPAAGGVAGGLLGELVDPFGGGIAGAALGAGLAGAGGAAGKAVENASQGESPLQTNDLTSGLESAVGQGIGSGVGRVVGAIGSLAAKPADAVASKLVQGQFNLTPGEATGLGAADLGKFLQQNGITDVQDVAKIVPHITGSVEGDVAPALTSGVSAGLNNAGTGGLLTDVSHLRTNLGQYLQGGATKTGAEIMNPSQIKNVTANVGQVLDNLNPVSTGTDQGISLLAKPADVYQGFQTLRDAAAPLLARPDPAQNAIGQIYNNMAQDLRTAAFNPGGQSLPLTDEIKSNIIKDLSPIADVNPTAHANLVQGVANAQNLEDLNPLQQQWVQASRALQSTNAKAQGAGGLATGDILAGGAVAAKNLPGAAVSLLTKSPAVDRVGASTLSKLSNLLTAPAMKTALSAGGGAAGVVSGNSPNYASPDQSVLSSIQGGTMQPGSQVPGQATLANGQPINNADILAQLDRMLAVDPALAPSFTPAIQALAQPVQAANAAQSALSSYQGTLGAAGGPQGPVGGLVSTLGGAVLGGPSSQVASQQSLLEALLAKAGIPNTTIPGLYANPQGSGVGLGAPQSVLSTIGAQ